MELKGCLTKGQVLVWRTEITFDEGKTKCVSPAFQLRGLHKKGSCPRDGAQDFRVHCSAADQDEGSLVHSVSYHHIDIDAACSFRLIFFKDKDAVQEQIKDFCSHGKLAFMLIFTGTDEPICLNPQSDDESVKTILYPAWENLSLDFSFSKEREEYPDLYIQCGDSVIRAHRSVLALHSEVFSAKLKSKMKEPDSILRISHVETPVFMLFLKALYSDKLPDISEDTIHKLYAVCGKYAVLSLKKLCSERMVNCLSEDNYQNYLLLADTYNDDDLRSSVSSFICNHPEFLRSDSWLKFSEKYPRLANTVYQNYLGKTVDLIGSTSNVKQEIGEDL